MTTAGGTVGAAGAATAFVTKGFDGFALAAGFGGALLAAEPNSDASGALWLTPPL